MVVAAHPFVEAKRAKQTPKVGETNAGVCVASKNQVDQLVLIQKQALRRRLAYDPRAQNRSKEYYLLIQSTGKT